MGDAVSDYVGVIILTGKTMEFDKRQSDSQMAKLNTQVAVLETKVEQLSDAVKAMKDDYASHIEKEEAFQEKVISQFEKINSQLSRYQGTVGGLMLAFTAITAFLGFFKDWLFAHFQ